MLTTTHPTSVADLKANLGEELGVSGWHDVTQAEVDAFAEATGDCQWIHTNPERARTTPFGGTIAHGYYTLSLAPALLAEVVALDRFAMAVNYGLDKLRFPAPLPVGDRVRMRAPGRGGRVPGRGHSRPDLGVRARGWRQAGVRRRGPVSRR
jgi:acyl dehydratase